MIRLAPPEPRSTVCRGGRHAGTVAHHRARGLPGGDGTAAHTDGIGASAQIHRPRGLCSDGTSIYWVEFNQHTVRQGVLATASVSTMAGTAGSSGSADGVGLAAGFDGPFSVAYHFPSRALYVVDSANAVIRRIQ